MLGVTVNKFRKPLLGGNQFLALSVYKTLLPPTTAMMMQEASPPSKRMCARSLPDWDSFIVHPDKQTHIITNFIIQMDVDRYLLFF